MLAVGIELLERSEAAGKRHKNGDAGRWARACVRYLERRTGLRFAPRHRARLVAVYGQTFAGTDHFAK